MHMQNHPPLKDRNNKVCMWGDVPDVMIPVKFDVDCSGVFDPRGLKIGVFVFHGIQHCSEMTSPSGDTYIPVCSSANAQVGSLQRSPRLHCWILGAYSKGKEERKGQIRGKEVPPPPFQIPIWNGGGGGMANTKYQIPNSIRHCDMSSSN